MHQLKYPTPERWLRLSEVCFLTGLPRSTLYYRISRGLFPKPQKMGRVSVWPFSEVDRYISDPNRYSQVKKAETPVQMEPLQKTNIGE